MLRLVWLSALYLLGAWYAEAYIHAPGDVTLFWPSAGIAIAAVMCFGPRWALFLPIPVLLTHWWFSPVPASFLPFSVGSNLLGTLAGYYAAGIPHGTLPKLRVRTGLRTLLGAMAMVSVSSTIGTIGLICAGMIPAAAALPSLVKWGMGDLLGIVSVAPATVFLVSRAWRRAGLDDVLVPGASVREKVLWLLSLAGIYALLLAGHMQYGLYALGFVSLPLGLLLWSAIRFEPGWTILSTALATLVMTTLTGLGLAGFHPPQDPLDSALLLGFMCLFAIVPMMLLAAMAEQRAAHRRALQRAIVDDATGLPNRAAFEAAMTPSAERSGEPGALAYLDLDHLSLVNDTTGHLAGDALIQGVASLLRARIAREDRVFRIGGDEFALLLRGSPAGIRQRVDDILHAIEHYRVGWEDRALSCTASIGLVMIDPQDDDASQWLAQADTACFTAKELGGNRVCVASRTAPGEPQQRAEAMRWAVRIREALDRGLFELYCQSIEPLRPHDEHGHHIEILLRMRDPDTGQSLAPGQFIPAAERFQLGIALDRHVVELVLDWLESHPEETAHLDLCAINLTAASMVDDAFGQYVVERVLRSSVQAKKLCFEITETSAVRDLARAQALIAQLRALGCAFALDDFGTGFCSFNYLHALDVDYFKIDGSFVRNLSQSPLSAAVVRSITDIAHVLNRTTIAEQVENEDTLAVLRALGVDYAQGYAMHRPEPLGRFFESHAPACEHA